MNTKFYLCRQCGNLVNLIHDAGVPLMCCGQKMEALEPNATEASGEKHLPVVTKLPSARKTTKQLPFMHTATSMACGWQSYNAPGMPQSNGPRILKRPFCQIPFFRKPIAP